MSELALNPVEQALLRRTEQLNDLSANMANVSTPGAKSEKTFEVYVDQEVKLQTAQINVQGALKPSADQSQLAINGKAFFVLQDSLGEVQTARQLRVEMIDGYLKTSTGHYVMGEAGFINVDPTQSWNINGDGNIYQNEKFIDKIKLTDPNSQVMQGFIEQSNIDPAEQMIELIKISRSTESYQTVIKTQSKMTQSAFDQLGGL